MQSNLFVSLCILFLATASANTAWADVTEEQAERAQKMLEANDVDYEGKYVITRVLEYANGGGMISMQQVHDGLVVFDSDVAFHFVAGGKVVRNTDGSPKLMGTIQKLSGLAVDQDRLITEQRAIEIFSESARVVSIPSMTGQGPGTEIKGPQCAQSAESIDAELGIYQETYAWRVMCKKNRSPIMYINAISGSKLLFDSGIRS
jgi:Zn-dependent metalloprotease